MARDIAARITSIAAIEGEKSAKSVLSKENRSLLKNLCKRKATTNTKMPLGFST
jgi:hypothetical protein